MREKYKIIALLVLCLPFTIPYLYFNTNLFFDKIESQPIQVFFDTKQGFLFETSISVGENKTYMGQGEAYMQKYGSIPLITMIIENPLQNEISGFKIHFQNFNETLNFWDSDGFGQKYNFTRAQEYMTTHSPDFLILMPFAEDGQVPIYSQVWGSQQIPMGHPTKPLLCQTSYGVWECEYFFNSGSDPVSAYNSTFLPANVDKIEFKVYIPKGYSIENIGSYKLENINGRNVLSQELGVGDTLHLAIKDNNANSITMVTSFFSPMMVGILLGIVAQRIYDGKKDRKKHSK